MKKGFVGLLGGIVGAVAGAAVTGKTMSETIDKKDAQINKFKTYYNVLNHWLRAKQEGKKLSDFFVSNEYKTVAIYGMGEIGNRLFDELKAEDVTIKYVMDQNAGSVYADIEVLGIDDELPEVDVIVVTAMFAYNEISEQLKEKTDATVISVEDVIYDL